MLILISTKSINYYRERQNSVLSFLYNEEDSLFMVKTRIHDCAMLFIEVIQMDLVQIGKFIAELRKEQKLTQEQFGEKLGVTNKTVSRWETGTYLPPADILLMISQLFNVSINEIICGKRLTMEEYKEAAEINLANTLKSSSFSLKEKIDFYKTKWLKEHIAIMVLIGVCIIGIMLTGILCKQDLLITIAVLLIPVAHIWRYNIMMAYVERNAYDGRGTT